MKKKEKTDHYVITIPLNVTKQQELYLLHYSKYSNKLYNYLLSDALKRYNLYNLYKFKFLNIIKNTPNDNKKIKQKVFTTLKDNFFKSFINIPNYQNYLNNKTQSLGKGFYLDTPNYYLTNLNIQNIIDDKDWITDNKHIAHFNGCKISAYQHNSFQNKTLKIIGSQVAKNIAKTITNKFYQKIKKPESVGKLKFRKGYDIFSFTNSHNNSNLTFSLDEQNFAVVNLIDIQLKSNLPIDKMKNPRILESFHILKNNHNICMCTIKQELINNQRRWFVDVTVDGLPPFKKLNPIDDNCGLDLGPKNFAIVTSNSTNYIPLHNLNKSQNELNHINKLLSKKIPLHIQHSWNTKKKLKYKQSKSYKHLLNKKKQIERKFKIASNIEIHKLAKSIAPYKNIYLEDISYKSWQNNFGKSVSIFKPAYFKNKLQQFAHYYKNNVHLINIKAALSQYCICGNKQKKSLSERTHVCPICGLNIQRDTLSALLTIYTDVETLKIDFSKAKKHVDFLKFNNII